MVLKVLSIVVVGFLIYLIFFKKSREENIANKNEEIEEELVQCPTCKTYVSKSEGILSNRNYYCSKDCLK